MTILIVATRQDTSPLMLQPRGKFLWWSLAPHTDISDRFIILWLGTSVLTYIPAVNPFVFSVFSPCAQVPLRPCPTNMNMRDTTVTRATPTRRYSTDTLELINTTRGHLFERYRSCALSILTSLRVLSFCRMTLPVLCSKHTKRSRTCTH